MIRTPKSQQVETYDQGIATLAELGLPAIIRPLFPLGDFGSNIVYDKEQFENILRAALQASPTHEVLIKQLMTEDRFKDA